MPWHVQPMEQTFPGPGPVPRRWPDGRILIRRLKLTPDGPEPAGYRLIRPGEHDFATWDAFLRSHGE